MLLSESCWNDRHDVLKSPRACTECGKVTTVAEYAPTGDRAHFACYPCWLAGETAQLEKRISNMGAFNDWWRRSGHWLYDGRPFAMRAWLAGRFRHLPSAQFFC